MYSQLPTTRKEAKRTGLKYYFTGKPCKNGHMENRNAETAVCVQCNRDNVGRYSGNIQPSLICNVAKEIGNLSRNHKLRSALIDFEAISSKPDLLVQLEAIRDQFVAIITSSELG